MAKDPVTGPISREKFAELVASPYGEACKEIRKHDPMWGRKAGEKIRWRVSFSRTSHETGYAIVAACSEKEAEKIACDLDDSKIAWDYDDCDLAQVEDVSPDVGQ
jgi:hypothetical protein